MRSWILIILVLLAGCATKIPPKNPQDPYEKLNRHTYQLNDGLDRAIVKPIVTVYQTLTPWPLRKGIGNFFSNIGEIPTIFNGLLQGQFQQAWSDTWRLAINTTVGLLGFVDVASKLDLPKHRADFGMTLGKWGYKSSAYLVLPVFGPHTVRDAIGLPVDRFAFGIYPHIASVPWRNRIYGMSLVDRRASLATAEKVIYQAALDPYQFQRDAYLQWRKHRISPKDGIDVD